MRLTKLNQLIEDGKAIGGRWEFGEDHLIQFRSLGKDEELKVKGSLVAAEPGTLVISVDDKQSDQLTTSRLLKLSGKWRTNAKNQLVFGVKKSEGDTDTLTFTGGWRVGEFQELLYTYEVRDLKTERKELKLLVFQGDWDFSEKHRLVFSVGGASDSAFRFRGAFQTRSILAKKGEIRYQLGVETSGRRRVQDVVLFGKWKYSDKFGLSFEMEYEEGRKRTITFGGEVAVTQKDRVEVDLKTRVGEPLGIALLLTRDIFGKDGETFARLQRWDGETRAEAGMRFRW